MNLRSRTFVLLRLGWRAGTTSEAGTLRYIALTLATLAMCLSSVALATVDITYAARADREVARAPITHLPDSPGKPVALWGASFDTVDDRQYSVVFVEPLVPDAPIPPGLSAWPAPGHAALSPGLAEAGHGESITARFGVAAGVIGPAGLSAPDERLAYVRPPQGLLPKTIMQEIEGFGSPSQPPLGDALFIQSASTFRLVVSFLMIVPAFVLLLVAARTGAKGRDQRFALVATLGGGRYARTMISLGDGILPIVTASVGGLAAVAALTSSDLRIPFVKYHLLAADMKGSVTTLVAACLISGLASAVIVILSDNIGPRRRRSTRPTGKAKSPVWTAALAPVMLLVATRGPDLFPARSPLHMLTNYVGVAGTLLMLPALVGLCAKFFGMRLASAARRWRLSGSLLAGRWMSSEPRAVARATAGIVAAVCILIQIQVWSSFLGDPVREARTAVAVAGDGMQLVKVKSDAAPQQLDHFYTAIAGIGLPLKLVNSPTTRSLRITASCDALKRADLPCAASAGTEIRSRQPRTRMLIDIMDSPGYTVSSIVGDPAAATEDKDSFSVVALVSDNGAALDRPAIEAAAYRTLPGGADVSRVGGDWLVGANVNADHARWIVLLGVFSLVVLALACTLGALGEYVRWSRALAPISVLSGSRRVFWSSGAWSVFVPITLAGAVSIPIGVLLAYPQTEGGRSSVSADLLQACATGVALIGGAIYLWALKSSRDITSKWQPNGN